MSDSVGISIANSIRMIAQSQEGFQIKDWLPAVIAISSSLFALYIIKRQSEREYSNALKIWRRQAEISLHGEWETSVRKCVAKLTHHITMALADISALASLPAFGSDEKRYEFYKQKMANTRGLSIESSDYEMLIDRTDVSEESSYQRIYNVMKKIGSLGDALDAGTINREEVAQEVKVISEVQAHFMNDIKGIMITRRNRIIEA